MKTKEESIEQVRENNYSDFLKLYEYAKEWLKARVKAFTSEDFKDDYYAAGNDPLQEPRVVGAVFQSLYRDGLASPKNEFVVSRNPTCHGRPQRVWISRCVVKEVKAPVMNNQLQMSFQP